MYLKQLIKDVITKECNIMVSITEEYLLLQQNGTIKNDREWFNFLNHSLTQYKYSVIGDVDMFHCWLNEQRFNELPNRSSGSTYTALTDVDGIYCHFENTLEEMQDEDFREEMYQLIDTLLSGK